jgi:hypothetical protein
MRSMRGQENSINDGTGLFYETDEVDHSHSVFHFAPPPDEKRISK